ncbi:hypothetical protein [Magnetospirillum moscoviense]|uniref:hypothetical protein n=1 Tax=Magnetospirillum moscoviense TaxID=1437059 RepID=UPI001FE0A441|nr:hypothetical protein [Magnetospirillum moscoviense]
MDQEVAANDRLAEAAKGSVADTILAERTNWLAEQASKGLADANGELAQSYTQVQKSRANNDTVRAVADLEREIDAQVRLAEAVRGSDRTKVRDVTIDNDVAKFARSHKLSEDDPKLDEYRAARSRQYAESVMLDAGNKSFPSITYGSGSSPGMTKTLVWVLSRTFHRHQRKRPGAAIAPGRFRLTQKAYSRRPRARASTRYSLPTSDEVKVPVKTSA